jgi:Ca-activated chloride channel family protein
MRKDIFEQMILDYLDKNLNPEETKEFESAMSADDALKQVFDEYQEVITLERSLAGVSEAPHPSFSVKVLESIDSDAGFFKRNIMELIRSRRALAFAASSACLLLCVGLLIQNESVVGKKFNRRAKVAEGPTTTYNDERMSDSTGSLLGYILPGDSYVAEEEAAPAPMKESLKQAEPAAKAPLPSQLNAPQTNSMRLDRSRENRAGAGGVTTSDLMGRSIAAPKSKKRQQLAGKNYSISQDGSAGTSKLAEKKARSVKADTGSRYGKGEASFASNMKDFEKTLTPNERKVYNPSPLNQRWTPSVAERADKAGLSREEYLAAEKSLDDKVEGAFQLNESAPGFQKPIQQAQVQGEQYGQWEENKATAVSSEPLSTFSIDVDTGSYTNARRFLNRGSLPPAHSIRIEEFVNYFSYNYEAPTDKPFALNYEIAPSPLEQDRYLLKLGLKAKKTSDGDKPWNLVFLIDVSGSMSSNDKLGLANQALSELVRNMGPQDRVSIVTYAGNSGVLLKPTGMQHKENIIRAINSLGAGGSTHGSAGIHGAYEVARNSFIQSGVNRVVLITDGDFNVGTTGNAQLISLIEEKRRSGVTLTTVGVGTGNYNEAMMEQLANKGNGNYFYLDSLKEAKKVFGHDLASNMEVVAKDVKIQIEFNPAVVTQYRLIGYDNRRLKKEDFNNDRIDAGEVGTGHTVTALYEVVLTDSTLGKQLKEELRYKQKAPVSEKAVSPELLKELGFFKLRYKEPTATRSKLLTFPLRTENVKGRVSDTSSDFRFAAAVSYFGHKLRQSTYAGDYSYDDIHELASSALGEDKKGYRKEFLGLVNRANR